MRITSRLFLLVVALAACVAPSLAATPVAVFNFQMKSDTPDWKWLEKGLSDRITTDFTQERGLAVVARDEMQVLAQKMSWVPEMATTDAKGMGQVKTQLKVETLVTGVYRVEGEQIYLTGQIVEVATRREVARKEVAGKAQDVLELQRRLSAELLSVVVSKPAAQILTQLPVWTRSLPAAKALYEGMDLYDQGRYAEAWLRFRQASKADAGYMEAVYWVGKMYYFMDRYEHARRALERFVYLDTTHPRVGDAMVEYVHTYEATEAAPEALLALYEDLARRFPNANVYQGRRWSLFTSTMLADQWFRCKRMRVLTQLGRNEEVLRDYGPVVSGPEWRSWTERDCPFPFGIVNLMDFHARTGAMPAFNIKMPGSVIGDTSKEISAAEGASTWLKFEPTAAAQAVAFSPKRLSGPGGDGGGDRTAIFDKPWAAVTVGLRAPSGYVLKALKFQSQTEGEGGSLEVRLRRVDTWYVNRGWLPAVRADLKESRTRGVVCDNPPRLGLLVAECRFEAARGALVVKGLTVTPTLAPMQGAGTLEVDCRTTADFRVYVDGALARWYPGVVGPLSPGQHEVRFVPAQPGSPYGEWSTTVAVEAGKTARLTGRLPWPEGSPWSSWTSTLVGTSYPGIDPGLWIFDDSRPAILADDEAVRLVWSYRGDLWSSVSTDGERFSPPQRLGLPVSSGWNETAPCLAKDERGRFILVFLSDRDARHRMLPYVCWSRDFVHWSAPGLVSDEGITEVRTLLADGRGRLVYLAYAAGGYKAFVSTDAYQWAAQPVPGSALIQDQTGQFIAYKLGGTPPGGPRPAKPFMCRLSCKKSSDLVTWSQEEVLAEAEWTGAVPQRPLIACQGKSGPAVLGFGQPDEWGLALWEPNAEGRWTLTGQMWGLLPDTANATYHPRWGYLVASMHSRTHGWWPQEASGPYLWRGPDLAPMRAYRNPVPPPALQKALPQEPSQNTFVMGPRGSLPQVGNWFNATDVAPPNAPKLPVGELAYVPAIRRVVEILKGSQHFRAAGPDSGTVHSQARIFMIDIGKQRLAVALDAEKGDAQQYDILRLDPTGRGDFRQALILRRNCLVHKAAKGEEQARFVYEFAGYLPAMDIGGIKIAPGLVIEYTEGTALGAGLEVRYELSTCAVGECRFGDKTYKVRFYDATGNLSVRDPARSPWDVNKPNMPEWGDWYCVDRYDDGQRVANYTNVAADKMRYDGKTWVINRKRLPTARYGQPVQIDGQWWTVRVADDGRHVTAEPYTGPMASLQLDHPYWRMVLVGAESLVYVVGGREPVPVPPGSYRVYEYNESCRADPDFTSSNLEVTAKEIPAVNLKAGATTTLALGSPLRGPLRVEQKDGALLFHAAPLQDVGGRSVSIEHFYDDRSQRNFQLKITLSQGGGQGSTTFETTAYEASTRGWKIPPGFTGTYTVTVELPDTFPATFASATVTVR
jgi:TolB-like protein